MHVNWIWFWLILINVFQNYKAFYVTRKIMHFFHAYEMGPRTNRIVTEREDPMRQLQWLSDTIPWCVVQLLAVIVMLVYRHWCLQMLLPPDHWQDHFRVCDDYLISHYFDGYTITDAKIIVIFTLWENSTFCTSYLFNADDHSRVIPQVSRSLQRRPGLRRPTLLVFSNHRYSLKQNSNAFNIIRSCWVDLKTFVVKFDSRRENRKLTLHEVRLTGRRNDFVYMKFYAF